MRKTQWKKDYTECQIERLDLPQQLEWFDRYITSEKHFSNTPTKYYGDHDPFDVPISACSNCGLDTQKLWSPKNGKPSWRVVCSCGTSGPACDYPRKAAFRWNKSFKSSPVNFQESPLFRLNGLEKMEALDRLVRINNDLTLRIEIAHLRKEVGENTSEGYIAKLVAYTEWIQYLSELVKNKSRCQQVNKLKAEEI